MHGTIKKHSDFIMDADAIKVISDAFIARARPTKFSDGGKYGIMATKRTFKHAVSRNRAKRLIRAWINACACKDIKLNPDFDYVFVARTNILNTDKPSGTAQMMRAIKKIGSSK